MTCQESDLYTVFMQYNLVTMVKVDANLGFSLINQEVESSLKQAELVSHSLHPCILAVLLFE